MNESALSNDPGTQKRRSTRIVQAVPLTVTGVDALGQPFKERTTTVMVNCHGCKYQSKHYVPKNCRSSCASELIAAGVPTVVVKDFLGHASVTTTEQYYINTKPALRSAAVARKVRLE